MKPIIAITAGDINGIGYEIILKGLYESYITDVCTPLVYGNAKVLRTHLMTLDGEMHNMQFNVVQKVEDVRDGKLNLLTCYPDDTPVQIGESTPEAGKASFLSLERACADLKAGKVQALVTAPINKANIQSEQFTFSGHTEYLQSVFADSGQDSLMMMVSECMRVALVCNHTPITQVAGMISQERILAKLRVLRKTLQEDFLIRRPRIAVLALNPHAGDDGLIGKEEQTVIVPAVKQANEEGIDAFGPYSADGFFGAGKYVHFDAVLAMYHDQGLIPFKSLDMSGVNFTAGLPVVRTSPDHGTAYDLAGKNEASALSFNHALYLALDVLRNRATSKEINRDPLVISEQPRPERPAGKFFIPPKEEFHD
ncbi:MAG: 4-hydroxythreonine-4-phosphate dehydrogenase PdxA [Paludibacteraceae bacterium]|nr:4-hydroxythreonine-4-phosphate dehydrogenase PdxA [Paludibacteraceae bacterium]